MYTWTREAEVKYVYCISSDPTQNGELKCFHCNSDYIPDIYRAIINLDNKSQSCNSCQSTIDLSFSKTCVPSASVDTRGIINDLTTSLFPVPLHTGVDNLLESAQQFQNEMHGIYFT